MPSIIKRGDTYRIMVSLGYGMDGKQIRKTTTYRPPADVTVNANLKMSVFAEKGCHFLPDSIQVYTALTTTSLVGLKPVKP